MKGYELGKHQYVCPYFKYIPCRIYVCVIVIEIFLLVAGAYILGKGSRRRRQIRWSYPQLKEPLSLS